VSRANGAAGAAADQGGFYPAIDANGGRVAFVSNSANLGTANPSGYELVYVRDLGASSTELVSRADGAAGSAADSSASEPAIDADGQRVAFVSSAGNLGGGHVSGDEDLYLRDVAIGTTTFVGHGAAGAGLAGGPSLDADGKRVSFQGVPAASSTYTVYLHDFQNGTTTVAARANGVAGAPATLNLGAVVNFAPASLSGNGDCLTFTSDSPGVVAGAPGPDFPAVYERVLRRECPADFPQTAIHGPSGPTRDNTPTFSFSSDEPRSTFACTLDSIAVVACASPFTTGALADGPHKFTVRATDAVGYQDPSPAVRSFKVDTKPPEISGLSVSPSPMHKRGRIKLRMSETAHVVFQVRRCRDRKCRKTDKRRVVHRRLKAGSSRVGLRKRGLRPGRYVLRAVATDPAGNSSKRAIARFRIA